MNIKVPAQVKKDGLRRKSVKGFVFGFGDNCGKKKGGGRATSRGKDNVFFYF